MVSAVATTLHYAMPDFISSRKARGWAKVGLTSVAVAASVPEMRAAWGAARQQQERDGEPLPSETFRSLPATSKAVVAGLMAAVLAGSTVGLVWTERRAFRHGQARATAGKRLPHTGPALVYGALAGGLWFLPAPPDPR